MLVLTRKVGETLVIDGRITISIVAVRQRQVRVSINAPKEVRILRGELAPLPNVANASNAAAANTAASNTSASTVVNSTVVNSTEQPLAADALDSSALDSSLFATADALVCESFGACHALGQDRHRWDADANLEMSSPVAADAELDANPEADAEINASATVPQTDVPTARPARPRRSLGLRGFRNARRNRAMAGHSNPSSANAVAARAATEEPAPASDVAHSVRATAG